MSVIDTNEVRRQYSEIICDLADTSNLRVRKAFSTVSRESFLGDGPWKIFLGPSYEPTSSADPRLVYQDVLIGLAPDRHINNGQPSLHALCIAAVDPRPGETVVHVGAGTGYYTAILAELVGSDGRVDAFEIEPDLADLARRYLSRWPHVQVHATTGCAALDKADVIYVSASVSEPAHEWLDALSDGGRLLCPLAPTGGYGGMLLATRAAGDVFDASILCRATFIPCVGAQASASGCASLADAFANKDLHQVRSLRRSHPPDASAWHAGDGWWLSTAKTGP